MKHRIILAAILVVTGLFLGVSHANAAVGPLIPGGLPTHNKAAALQKLMGRAAYDRYLQQTMARSTGAKSFKADDYQAVGYTNGAPKGTVNSAVDIGNGQVVTAQDTINCNKKSRMLEIRNKVTKAVMYVCTKCANPRIYSTRPAPKRKFVLKTALNVNKVISRIYTRTCPGTGERVLVRASSRIKGVIRGSAWGKVQGSLAARINVAFKGNLTQKVSIQCRGALLTKINFTKYLFDSSGKDISSSHTGDTFQVYLGIYDKQSDGSFQQSHPTMRVKMHPGTTQSISHYIRKGEGLYACVDPRDEDANNTVVANAQGNPDPKFGCLWVVYNGKGDVNYVFYNRQKPPKTVPPPSSPPPTTPPPPTPPLSPKTTVPQTNPNNEGQPTEPKIEGKENDPVTNTPAPADCVPSNDNNWCTGVSPS